MVRRNTKQRNLILKVVRSRCDHPTADQIVKDVQKVDEKISVGTVYRNLNLLASDGLIKNIKLPGADRYDLRTDPHNHFECEKCGKFFDVEMDNLKPEDKKNINGFIVHSHHTLFKGLCPECSKLEEK